ncbi:MAG: hypothetical protein CMJ86_00700 [Planctomycetes bacterium]|jgi:hypothetical protein|nr:hypothetical protein [Planctomycetota bacterium]
MSDSKQPIQSEDLLAAAMGEAEQAQILEHCSPKERQEFAEFEVFLKQIREQRYGEFERAGSQPFEHASPHLVNAILARTTREDLSLRGDLRLLGLFVRRRMEDSPILRAAAALLMLQLLFAPGVLAYLALRPGTPEPTLYLSIEEPVESGLREASEEPLEAFLPERPLDGVLGELSSNLRREEVRALARDLPPYAGLDSMEPSALEEPQGLENRLTAQRLDPTAPAGRLLSLAAADLEDPLVRALAIEACLDVLSRGSLGPDPEALLSRLLEDLPDGGDPVDQRLLGTALARVDAHGLLAGPGQSLLAELRRRAPRDPILAAGPRKGGPLSPAWKRALAAGLDRRGIVTGLASSLCAQD